MAGFLVMTPEETALVLRGAMEEPGYRPFPGRPDYNEVFDDEDDGSFEPRLPQAQELERIVAAKHWRRYSKGVLLLLARGDLPNVRGQDDALHLVAVAGAAGGPRLRPGARGMRRLTIGSWTPVRPPIPLARLVDSFLVGRQDEVRRIIDGPVRPLPPGLNAAITDILIQLFPDYVNLTFGFGERRQRGVQNIDRRDRVATSMRLFDRDWRSLTPSDTVTLSEFAQAIEISARGLENDFITDDAAVFPGWDRALRSMHGWWEFHSSRGRRLLVKNLNVSPSEARTGADLVYVRRDPDVVVLVQYKMLEKLQRTGEFVYRPDGRLAGQLDRMLSFGAASVGLLNQGSESTRDYRLGQGFTFIKFVEDPGSRPLGNDELTPGYYLPSELVRLMLATPEAGPSGGQVHYVKRHRYIDTGTFARLVQDSWIGSTGEATELLVQTLGLVPSGQRGDLTVAVDEPM